MCATHLGRQPPNENAARLERTKQLCDDLAAAQNDTKKCQEVIEQMRPERMLRFDGSRARPLSGMCAGTVDAVLERLSTYPTAAVP
jgi:hypothetical protein